MNRVRGMTIRQLNEILNEMRSVYNFKDEFTRLEDFRDLESNSNRQVCIHTIDENTNVEVVLCKKADIRE